MIQSKTDYQQYLEADRIASGRPVPTIGRCLVNLFFPDYIWKFHKLLRKAEYYKNTQRGAIGKLKYALVKARFRKHSLRLGFSIPENVFGPGLSIPHYGTIVVNAKARVGANCRIHVCTNIGTSGGSNKAPVLGDNVYIAPGAKIFGDIYIPNNTAIAANAAVNSSFEEEFTLLAGVPAKAVAKVDIKRMIKHI